MNSEVHIYKKNISNEVNDINKKTKNIVIIGAGPTAIGAIYRIFQLKKENLLKDFEITVIEQEIEAGGLARTITDNYGFSWDLGVHVTGASKYHEFINLLDSCIPHWEKVNRVVKADMAHVMKYDNLNYNLNYVPYPVQNSIPYFPNDIKNQCLNDLEATTNCEPKFDENFGKFSEKLFGKTIQSIFIRPYNEKVWTVKLEEMSCKWLEGRVSRIDAEQIRYRCKLNREQLELKDECQKSVFRYPGKVCGVGEMWKIIVEKMFPKNIFKFCTRAIKIDTALKQIFTKNLKTGEQETYNYTTLISTIPITALVKLSNILPEIGLRYSKVILVGIGLHLPKSDLASKLSWAYYPRSNIIFYRCTVLSNFSSALVPDANKYWSVLCEIGMLPNMPIEHKEKIINQTINDLVSVGMIESSEQVYSNWIKVLEYGYPIPTLNRDKILIETHEKLQANEIYSRGRFGGWRYEISNQDHSFECGLQVVNRIILGVSESLYECC